MALSTALAPPPIRTPMADRNGLITAPWLAWFQKVWNRVGEGTASTNSDIEALAMLGLLDESTAQAEDKAQPLSVLYMGRDDSADIETAELYSMLRRRPIIPDSISGAHTFTDTITFSGAAVFSGAVTLGNVTVTDAKNFTFNTGTGTKIGTGTTQKIGFWNATPVAQQTVTGSRGGNAALASLLTALATAGLIVDSTSA